MALNLFTREQLENIETEYRQLRSEGLAREAEEKRKQQWLEELLRREIQEEENRIRREEQERHRREREAQLRKMEETESRPKKSFWQRLLHR